MFSFCNLGANFLFFSGLSCAAMALLNGNSVAALLAIAGFVGSGLLAIADSLAISHQPAVAAKGKIWAEEKDETLIPEERA